MNIMEFESKDIDNLLHNYFPDGVEVHLVDDIDVLETSAPPGGLWEGPVPMNQVRLILTEIEPETGIFAAMSPVTHNVYVFIKDYAAYQ